MAMSPMMQQYHQAKETVGDALLLFRMGDFYELFHDDAKTAARELGLTLTSRDKGENAIPMAGFPHHQLDQYLARLIAGGFRAAICEQVEDPKEAKGLVKREVTRIVSRGTVTDDSLLSPEESNYLLAIVQGTSASKDAHLVGLAWVDLSTGRFYASTAPLVQCEDHVARIQPSEVICSDGQDIKQFLPQEGLAITSRPDWAFAIDQAHALLIKHFEVHNLDGFGFDPENVADALALRAAGAVIDYLQETQKASLNHIDRLIGTAAEDYLQIDAATRRSLEIASTIRTGRREGSLLSIIDQTVTAMGARMLASWIAAPLTDLTLITTRHDAVAELVSTSGKCQQLRELLKQTYDIERLLARVTTGRATPRDLSSLATTLGRLPELKQTSESFESQRLRQLNNAIDLCPEVRGNLEESLAEQCPIATREGGIIRPGYNSELDQLRELCAGGRKWMAEYQAQEIERTGIPSLKVGFNKVFGYYLEVTHAHRDKVPADYNRKQTLKNAERFITPELKEYEEKVLTADERGKELEYQLFVALREMVAAHAPRLRATANALAEVDVVAGLAHLARARNYVRPEMTEEPCLLVEEGRHPVLDITQPEGTFVPNGIQVQANRPHAASSDPSTSGEVRLDPAESTTQVTPGAILLITGPNMAGKSTYIRQAALLTLLAQIGSFVPASKARIGIADRIFARVGASDELSRGQSTFMVEMTETARILHAATERSLVILDEIGRGTSTYDGLSLAWSIVEHLHDHIGCRTLFATHYHELTALDQQLPGIRNWNVAVKEWDDKIAFLHRILPGAADKSYGINVAQLAGVPPEVNERAKQVLEWLESQHQSSHIHAAHDESTASSGPHVSFAGTESAQTTRQQRGEFQLTLFQWDEHPLIEEIRAANLAETTPMQALELLHRWKEKLQPNR